MRAIAIVLLIGSALVIQFTSAAEPAPSKQAVTHGWWRVTRGPETVERCFVDAELQQSAVEDLGEDCKTEKLAQQDEKFELLQTCQFDDDTIKGRVYGIARPGYLKVTSEFIEAPEELRAIFKDRLTFEAQRLRDCTAAELSKVRK
jgi:hypothetical protein